MIATEESLSENTPDDASIGINSPPPETVEMRKSLQTAVSACSQAN